MQVIAYERNDRDFFCPVTGQPVYNEEGEPVAPTFRAFWHAEVMDEPIIRDPDLQKAWDAYLAKVQAEDDLIDMQEFFGSMERKGWVAFEITTSGFACGPVWETVWTVLDLEWEDEAAWE